MSTRVDPLRDRYENKKFDTWGFIFKYVIPFLLIGVFIGGIIYFIWPYIKPLWNYIFPPAPLQCGGQCNNDTICNNQTNMCEKDCHGKKLWNIGGGICCDTEGASVTEEIVGNLCLKKCEPGTSRCGTTCFTNNEEVCVNNKVCNIRLAVTSQDSSGRVTQQCCDIVDGKQTFPLNGKCVSCPDSRKCGNNCCPSIVDEKPIDVFHRDNSHPGSQCVAPDGAQFCCDPKYVGKDSDTGIETCCQQELCGGKCCSGTNKKCNFYAVGGPTCQVSCGDGSKRIFCPDSSDLCVIDSYYGPQCYPKSCKWEQNMYVPNAVYDNTNGTGKNAQIIPVCSYKNNSPYTDLPNVAVNNMGLDLKSDTIIRLKPEELRPTCKSLQACIGKIQEAGMEHVEHNNKLIITDYTDPETKFNTTVCSGQSNCNILLPSLDQLSGKDQSYINRGGRVYRQDATKDITGYYKKTSCPAKNLGGTDSENCCYNPGDRTFNGYVCPDSQQCYLGKDNIHHCYDLNTIQQPTNYNLMNCNSHGNIKISNNTISCTCDKGYDGTSCQWSDIKECSNNGTVTAPINDVPVCKCNAGYEGSNCNTVIIVPDIDYNDSVYSNSWFYELYVLPGPGITLSLRINTILGTNDKGGGHFERKDFGASLISISYTAYYNKGGFNNLSTSGDIEYSFGAFGTFTLTVNGYSYVQKTPKNQLIPNLNIKMLAPAVCPNPNYLNRAAIVVIGIPI